MVNRVGGELWRLNPPLQRLVGREGLAHANIYTPRNRDARVCVMSRHSFDPEIAKQVGVNAAVIYQNILWWAERNAANNKHYHEGFWWTYNSVTAFAELFPYLTSKQIRTALDRLEDHKLIASGSFNKSAYDRTKWYAPTCLIGKHDLPSGANEIDLKGEPIPVINTDHKPDIILYNDHWLPLDAWNGWIDMRKKLKKPPTDRAIELALAKLEAMHQKGQDITEVLNRSTMNGWTDLYEIKETNNGKANRTGSNIQRGSSGDGFTAVLREVGSRDDAFQASNNDGGMQQAPRIGFIPSGRD